MSISPFEVKQDWNIRPWITFAFALDFPPNPLKLMQAVGMRLKGYISWISDPHIRSNSAGRPMFHLLIA
jgi:hypothetical protein